MEIVSDTTENKPRTLETRCREDAVARFKRKEAGRRKVLVDSDLSSPLHGELLGLSR